MNIHNSSTTCVCTVDRAISSRLASTAEEEEEYQSYYNLSNGVSMWQCL